MSFQPIDIGCKFNTANSCEFLTLYENALDAMILEDESRVPSRTFAPSQVRCKRVSWFRLREVMPELEEKVDRKLDFTAQIGTACHHRIQEVLSKALGDSWIDVEEYLNTHGCQYDYTCTKNGYETMIQISNPPVKFAPDGIIFFKGQYWLLEIKTSEYSSFDRLSETKSQHLDQIKCYCTLLGIHNVLVLYQDRLYGDLKCYEEHITDGDMLLTRLMFQEVMECVDKNIAPPRPEDRRYCSPSYCRYYNVCKQW